MRFLPFLAVLQVKKLLGSLSDFSSDILDKIYLGPADEANFISGVKLLDSVDLCAFKLTIKGLGLFIKR